MEQVESQRCEVWPWNIKDQLLHSVIVSANAYSVRGKGENLKRALQAAVVGKSDRFFFEPDHSRLEFLISLGEVFLTRISLKERVTDNSSRVLARALEAYGIAELGLQDVRSERLFLCQSSKAALDYLKDRGLYNPIIHEAQTVFLPDQVEKTKEWFEAAVPAFVEAQQLPEGDVAHFELDAPLKQWRKWNEENLWALSSDELEHLIAHYRSEGERRRREKLGLSPLPTDIELEIIAQTWSEHCKHKIFGAQIHYTESTTKQKSFGTCRVNGIFKSLIAGSTEKIRQAGKDFLISVFKDNAGIVRFDPQLDVCIKVETHNSPSALDPYGGALTGILGVNRDILGVGLGARPVANTNVFCVMESNPALLPEELLPPETVLEGIHRGVKDGGNKSGIPTVNGAFCYHPSFVGRPLVYCGTVGVLPPKTASGLETHRKRGAPGDAIIVVGGAVGKDGIHGATFSSMAMQQGPSATVVQIGDPFMQKCVTDFLLAARDRELYSALTDNGAGGLSSSIGEMAEVIGGATLDVSRVPLKYAGLAPWEIVVSESQERMSFAVPQKSKEAFLALAKEYHVDAAEIGIFHDKHCFDIVRGEELLASLDLDFLHQSLPPLNLVAHWDGPRSYSAPGLLEDGGVDRFVYEEKSGEEIFSALVKTLEAAEARSKRRRNFVAQYDQEVGAATLKKPQEGKNLLGVSDAAILDMKTLGGSDPALGIASGICPERSLQDPYEMAIYAIDEAIRNLVAAGINPERVALCDNFCWPDPTPGPKNPDASYNAAQLVRASFGLYDAAMAYQAPFVSGKDSMKNDVHPNQEHFAKISAVPTLLITAIGDKGSEGLLGTAFIQEGDEIVLIGKMPMETLYASELTKTLAGPCLPLENAPFDLHENAQLYRRLHRAMNAQLVRSCHDVSDEGALHCVWECCLDTPFGADLWPIGETDVQRIAFLSNAPTGCFIGSVEPGRFGRLSGEIGEENLVRIGKVSGQSGIRLYKGSTLWKHIQRL